MKVILLILYFIKSKLFHMFDFVARTALFAKLVFIFKLFVIAKLVEVTRYLWWLKELKKEGFDYSHHDHHHTEEDYHHFYGPQHYDHGPHPEGKKKKIKRAIKKAIIKLIIIALLIKHKIKMLLMAFQTFLLFKFVLLAGIYVVATIFKVWAEIKHKHHPQKVIYYENAHHQHHYDHDNDHYDDHGWTGGLWGRSMVVPDMSGDTTHQTQPQSAHYDAYSAHVPKHN
ncbi:hypothetical protein AAG570_000317 [Ranatra chinensis]|uniref:Uncharacterized protein n=1 Tax=Ranatra chinensis TaxID=642074 RepID=A0ABD0YWQ0_9HEMI